MKNYSIALLFSPFFSSTFASAMEKMVLAELLENTDKEVKDYCIQESGKKLFVRDFISLYINWTLTSGNLLETQRSLKCDNKKTDRNACRFAYSANEKPDKSMPAWRIDLEFNFSQKKGIDWSSIQCVSTP